MPKVSKFTKEQKLEIALELISGDSHNEVCRQHGIRSSYAYRLKDRALECVRQGIDHAVEKPRGREKELEKRVGELEQLAGEQALTIRDLKRTKGWSLRWCRSDRKRG